MWQCRGVGLLFAWEQHVESSCVSMPYYIEKRIVQRQVDNICFVELRLMFWY